MHYQAPGVEHEGRPARIAAENVWLDAFTENDIHTTGRYVDGDEIVDFAVMTGVHSGPLPLPGGAVLPPTGRRMSGAYVARYRIVEGKVAHQQIYDRLAVLSPAWPPLRPWPTPCAGPAMLTTNSGPSWATSSAPRGSWNSCCSWATTQPRPTS